MTLEFQYIFAGKGIGPGKIDCDPTINDTFVIIEKNCLNKRVLELARNLIRLVLRAGF
jgi:hypothetical protein